MAATKGNKPINTREAIIHAVVLAHSSICSRYGQIRPSSDTLVGGPEKTTARKYTATTGERYPAA
jgi:hypothetical protein